MSIQVQHLTKTYGEQKAVNDISFAVGKSEIVGFLGPNGAGKSTTMKIITGYLQPDAGEVAVCGIPVLKDTLAAKKKIGYLPEANPLYYDMYVKEYLGFIAQVHQLGRGAAGRINEVIELTGLTLEYKKLVGQLSKGYKQRVGLAGALLHDPEVLILDEPTSGLDPNQLVEIREVIRNLGKNKTVLFSSHILQEVEALCDRVIIINKGGIVADDRLVNLQQQGEGRNIITLVVRETIEEQLFMNEALVQSFVQSEPGRWQLTTTSSDLLKKRLLELALQNNWNIVSLHGENASLENIFRSLTQLQTGIPA